MEKWRISVDYRWEQAGPKRQTGSDAEPKFLEFDSEDSAKAAINPDYLTSLWRPPHVDCRLTKISVEVQKEVNGRWERTAPPIDFNV